ncbi:MAG: transposase [Luteolibacter sp.]|uniref:IS66 family transposase n=1 Tax=Luteolibacter sp. TaxID=1962973 RepID=UPI003267569F
MKLRSNTSRPAPARPARATSGSCTVPVAMFSISGTRAASRPASAICWETSAASCSATGYAAYGSHAAKRPGIVLAACWAHPRRKFHEALQTRQPLAEGPLQTIARLYLVEKELRETRAGPAARMETRIRSSAALLETLQITEGTDRFFRPSCELWKKEAKMSFIIRPGFGCWETGKESGVYHRKDHQQNNTR